MKQSIKIFKSISAFSHTMNEKLWGMRQAGRALCGVLFINMMIGLACNKGAVPPPATNNPPPANPGSDKKDLFQADPTIFEENGTFYLYGTNDENPNQGFQVFTSKDLKEWEGPKGYRNGYALSGIENYGTRGFWAPQVFKSGDTYYMAYTADEHIAISTSTSLTGPFTQNDQNGIFAGTQKQIDPFVFRDDDGEKYLFYVDISNGNKIFMTGLNDDYLSVNNETGMECLRTTEGWENKGQPSAHVIEGPTVIKHKGYYYLIYSANHFENPNYAVGYATSENINGPWKKYEGNPVLSIDKVSWAGTGHGDLIMKENGSLYTDNAGNMVYVFHTHNTKESSKKVPRRTAVIKMKWKESSEEPDILEMVSGSFEHLKANK